MKSFLIVGMSTYGVHLCKKLHSLGAEVMIVDKDAEIVETMAKYAVSAKIADCTGENVLDSFGVDEFDACFVALGGNFSDALEICYRLKELGAKKVITEVNRDIEIKFMLRNGADRVVYPELDSALRVAVSESDDSVFDAIDLGENYAIYEISVPQKWTGKTVKELNIRVKHNLNVIAIKKDGQITPVLSPDHQFSSSEHIMIMGHTKDIAKIL